MDDRMALLATATKALVDSYTESESQRLTAARMAISLVIQALTAAAQKEDYDIDLIDKLHHLQTELHATEAEIDAALAEPAAQRKAGIAVFSHSPADWTPEMVEAFNKYRSAQEPEAAMDEPVALAAEDEGSPRTEPWPQSVIDSIREQADRAQGLVDRMFQPPTQVECVPASHSWDLYTHDPLQWPAYCELACVVCGKRQWFIKASAPPEGAVPCPAQDAC